MGTLFSDKRRSQFPVHFCGPQSLIMVLIVDGENIAYLRVI